ncbi:MAG: preprotein translocase subunit SecY [Alphaproteobacteria bacterium]|nr:preprotein translocase subunit SecY [Alphaproteobacteria bacterium]
MFEFIANIMRIPDLRNRILFTLAMLGVYRLGVFIPAPGVDRTALADFFANNQNSLFGMYDMFTGGALEQFSVFVLGIMPYISASIIIQLMTVVMPQVERLKNEGQSGRNKITQWTRYLTIGIAIIQSSAIAVSLEQMKTLGGTDVVIEAGWPFRLMTIITMTAGSCFIMWLGEQITDRGIGNGASLIITCGIIAALPNGVRQTVEMVRIEQINLLELVLMLGFMVAVIMGIVFVERGQRKIPIQYAKRVVGRQVYGGQATHLPMKVNVSGVIPPIFASSVLMFPATVGTFYDHPLFEAMQSAFMPGSWVYNVTYVVMIVFFAYFYTAVTFNPVDVADNLRKHGGYIPGVRPGKQTADYLDRILTRLTAGGSIYLASICILPTVLISNYGVPFYFGGTGLLIIVSVALDTVGQIEGHLLTRHYDGILGPKSSKVKGRRSKMLTL